ncbi:MAG: hypothetical protein PHO74_00340 [Weeksellaceae bacterium]|jgi:hypothetical protein|nr:hypothetical protein [Weeksellaceae bacterium]
MKVTMTLPALLLGAFLTAQIGISENNSVSLDDSEVLRVESTNKGILIPNVMLTDLNNPSPVTNPAETLFVYNADPNVGMGFYTWLSNKWEPLIDSRNVYAYAGIVRTEIAESNAVLIDDDETGATTYNIGDTPGTRWKLIPGTTKTFDIFSPINNLSISVGGTVQTNSVAVLQSHSYAVAIFIDGSIAAVRNFTLDGDSVCLYSDFNVFMTTNNLDVGTHTVEVRETFRVNNANGTYQPNGGLVFGAKHPSCTNINDDIARTLVSIQISEKPNN